MGFSGLNPEVLRELAASSDLVLRGVNDLARRAASIVSDHQLEECAGRLWAQFDEVHDELSALSRLSLRKATDMEQAASAGFGTALAARIVEGWDGAESDLPPGFLGLFAELLYIRRAINAGDDDEMAAWELAAVVARLSEMDADERAWVLSQLTDTELARLFHNVNSSEGFWVWPWGVEQREEFYELLECLPDDEAVRFALADVRTQVNDPEAQEALESLLASDGYRACSPDQKVALLSQARNYPNAKAIYNLERLAAKDWVRRDFDLEDFQRSAKLVAFLSHYPDGDQEIIDNTLDVLLAEDSPYRFDWWVPEEWDGVDAITLNGAIHFNQGLLDPGNMGVLESIPVDPDDHTSPDLESFLDDIVSTTVHETNHLVNPAEPGPTYRYFMEEYRAYYVAFMARHGRRPTRAEMQDTLILVLAGYRNIERALEDPVEGARIAAFVNQVLGTDQQPEDLVDYLVDTGVADGDEPAPVPVSVDGGPNNIDNSPS